MSILEFIEKIIGHISWPVSAIMIAIVFRPVFKLIVEKIRKISYKEMTTDFSDNTINAAENLADSPEAQKLENLNDIQKIDALTKETIMRDPREAIASQWRSMQTVFIDLCKIHKIDPDLREFQSTITKLVDVKAISEGLAAALINLRKGYKRSIRLNEFNDEFDDVMKYIQAAKQTESIISNLIKNSKNK